MACNTILHHLGTYTILILCQNTYDTKIVVYVLLFETCYIAKL